jgi:integrase
VAEKRAITDRWLRSASTDRPQEHTKDTIQRGFSVIVSGRTGAKTYHVRTSFGGKQPSRTIGTYPEISVRDARRLAHDAIEYAREGVDPRSLRLVETSNGYLAWDEPDHLLTHAEPHTGIADGGESDRSFKAMAEEVLRAKAPITRPRTQYDRRKILDNHLAVWSDRQAASITRRDVVLLVERIALKGTPVMANRVLAMIKMLFNEGVRRGFPGVEANPAHLVSKPAPEGGREVVLHRDELGRLWKEIEREKDTTANIFKLALLTAQRIGSVCSMAWGDLEDHLWVIPAKKFKGRREHLVPLARESVAVLEYQRLISGTEAYVFPSRGGAKKPHITNPTNAAVRLRARTGGVWTPHDFRTTFRAWATRSVDPQRGEAGLGILPDVADLVLGHAPQSLRFKPYTADESEYRLDEKRDALEKWAAFVMQCARDIGRPPLGHLSPREARTVWTRNTRPPQ